jgi:post-segregation antitoxin (ccd killing protein)
MKTLASIEISLANLLDALGTRAAADPLGVQLAHDIRGILNAAATYRAAGIERADLAELADRALAIKMRAQSYLATRREPLEVSAAAQTAIAEAVAGPRDSATLEQCPACVGCHLCHDARMVTVGAASLWRMGKKHDPSGA